MLWSARHDSTEWKHSERISWKTFWENSYRPVPVPKDAGRSVDGWRANQRPNAFPRETVSETTEVEDPVGDWRERVACWGENGGVWNYCFVFIKREIWDERTPELTVHTDVDGGGTTTRITTYFFLMLVYYLLEMCFTNAVFFPLKKFLLAHVGDHLHQPNLVPNFLLARLPVFARRVVVHESVHRFLDTICRVLAEVDRWPQLVPLFLPFFVRGETEPVRQDRRDVRLRRGMIDLGSRSAV